MVNDDSARATGHRGLSGSRFSGGHPSSHRSLHMGRLAAAPQVSACTRGWRASGQGTASTPQGTCTGAARPLLLSPPSVSPPSHGRGSARSVLSSGSQPCWWLRACGLRPRVREGPLSGRIPVTAQFRPGGKRDLSKAPAPQGDLSPSVSWGQPRRGVTSGEPPLK